MVFSSLVFLFCFLPATLLVYFVVPKQLKNIVLAIASLVFYVWGTGLLVWAFLASVVVNFAFGLAASTNKSWGPLKVRYLAVAGAVVANVGLLGYFKYSHFLEQQATPLLQFFGVATPETAASVLPLGISFFTFQAMSYVIDVSRGVHPPLKRLHDFLLFKANFAQLIAGPIVRYVEIGKELASRRTSLDDFSCGALRFCHGLAKKTIVADPLGGIANLAFNPTPDVPLGFGTAWIGLLAYTFQIYFDFSGYSDMAIGLGRIFGFHFPENFNRPYSSVSITDFWRRWHMTLSRWFRDYVYIPLGGSRASVPRTYLNLTLVFLLTGFWHGANWTFLVWGAYHGTALVVEKLLKLRELPESRLPVLRRVATLLVVMVGWVIFRSDSVAHAWSYLTTLVSPGSLSPSLDMALALNNQTMVILGVACASVLLPRDFVTGRYITEATGLRPGLVRAVVLCIALPWALLTAARGSFSPFLYFQF